MTDLGTLGGRDSHAYAIDDHGRVAGESDVPPGRLHAVGSHAVLWRDGRILDLGTLGGTESRALGMDGRGRVVGSSRVVLGRRGRMVSEAVHAFVWEEGLGMRDLGTLGGRNSVARAIDGRGRIVGDSETRPDRLHRTSVRAFVREGERMRELATLGGDESRARAADATGWIVGTSRLEAPGPGRAPVHAVLWRDGAIVDLGGRDGGDSAARGVRAPRVVGTRQTAAERSEGLTVHATLWIVR